MSWAAPGDGEECVYFIRGGDFIKIGKSNEVRRRLMALRTMSPVPLTLLVTVPGYTAFEAEMHERFRQDRHHGEWFRPSQELHRFISEARCPIYQERRAYEVNVVQLHADAQRRRLTRSGT